jgi:hypothetical protein
VVSDLRSRHETSATISAVVPVAERRRESKVTVTEGWVEQKVASQGAAAAVVASDEDDEREGGWAMLRTSSITLGAFSTLAFVLLKYSGELRNHRSRTGWETNSSRTGVSIVAVEEEEEEEEEEGEETRDENICCRSMPTSPLIRPLSLDLLANHQAGMLRTSFTAVPKGDLFTMNRDKHTVAVRKETR